MSTCPQWKMPVKGGQYLWCTGERATVEEVNGSMTVVSFPNGRTANVPTGTLGMNRSLQKEVVNAVAG